MATHASGFMSSGSAQPSLTFDDLCKLRVLPAAQFDTSEKLKQECQDFTTKISEFNGIVHSFTEMVASKASEIEKEKLKAIGLRNRVMRETETREREEARYTALIKERQAELDRLAAQLESLQKVEMEQAAFIESLANK